jgi:hypothetical protein
MLFELLRQHVQAATRIHVPVDHEHCLTLRELLRWQGVAVRSGCPWRSDLLLGFDRLKMCFAIVFLLVLRAIGSGRKRSEGAVPMILVSSYKRLCPVF